MTELKTYKSKRYSTDSKVNYGMKNRSIVQNQDPELLNFISGLNQSEEYAFKKNTNQTTKRNNQIAASRLTNGFNKYKEFAVDPKNLLLLVAIIVLCIGIYIFDITLQLGPDQDCWQQFKDNNCSFTSPSGLTCRRLLKCISGESWQLDILYFLLAGLAGWGGFRFRRQIKIGILKAIQLWQVFLENK